MTKKIELSLEKGKSIENAWDANDNKLNSLINDCLNIENNIEEITTINKKIDKYKSKSIDICFKPEQNEIDDFLYIIQNFGNVKLNNKNVLGKLLKQENLELLTNWLKTDNNNINEVKYELVYDAKKNGDNKDNFHKFCDKIGPSLLVVKTESNYIFGGYTKENWETINNDIITKKDETAFLFSLNNKQRIKVKKSENAIIIDNDYGPIFGKGNAYEICLSYPFLSNNVQICDKGDYGDKDYILTGNKSKKPVEIEIYKVVF